MAAVLAAGPGLLEPPLRCLARASPAHRRDRRDVTASMPITSRISFHRGSPRADRAAPVSTASPPQPFRAPFSTSPASSRTTSRAKQAERAIAGGLAWRAWQRCRSHSRPRLRRLADAFIANGHESWKAAPSSGLGVARPGRRWKWQLHRHPQRSREAGVEGGGTRHPLIRPSCASPPRLPGPIQPPASPRSPAAEGAGVCFGAAEALGARPVPDRRAADMPRPSHAGAAAHSALRDRGLLQIDTP